MQLVLDSNEYIFAFGLAKKGICVNLFKRILETAPSHQIHICRTIVDETRKNDEDFFVPFNLGIKYESEGLKPADAFIAAYTEWTGADILVSENRHFLTRHGSLPFRVLSAAKTLRLL